MDRRPFPEYAGIAAALARRMITVSQSTNVQKTKIVPILGAPWPFGTASAPDNTRAITSRSRTSWVESLLPPIPA